VPGDDTHRDLEIVHEDTFSLADRAQDDLMEMTRIRDVRGEGFQGDKPSRMNLFAL
jgi:hypothetical protein